MSEHRRQEPVWTSVRGAGVKAVRPAERGGGAKRRALTSVSTRARCWLDDAAGDHDILRSTRVQFLSVPRARQHGRPHEGGRVADRVRGDVERGNERPQLVVEGGQALAGDVPGTGWRRSAPATRSPTAAAARLPRTTTRSSSSTASSTSKVTVAPAPISTPLRTTR